MKVLILAGGQGTRLWPLSRKVKPKQFHKLISEKTMLQETVNRLSGKIPLENIFISTVEEYLQEVKTELPKIPVKNIITEPEKKERVAAISLFIARLSKKALKEPLLVLPADHLIKNKDEFLRAVSVGEKFIKRNPRHLAILGTEPTFPDTGLGYIKKGPVLTNIENNKIYGITCFKEKPDLKKAKSYLKSGGYFWNTAIYLFYPEVIEQLIEEFVPKNYSIYKKIKASWGKKNFKKVVEEEYPKMSKISLEYTVMENYRHIALIPFGPGWSDVGSWSAIKSCLYSPEKKLIQGNFVGINSKNIVVHSGSFDRLVAGIGIEDLIIVVTDDIILISKEDQSQKAMDVVKKLEKRKKFRFI